MSEALTQVERNGNVETRLGHLWIISLYALWTDEYRPRLAKAHQRSPTDEKYDIFGDLRHLRNDVVHHRGIASADNTGRCVLLGHWFQPGSLIRLEGHHFDEFFRLIPWSDMVIGQTPRGTQGNSNPSASLSLPAGGTSHLPFAEYSGCGTPRTRVDEWASSPSGSGYARKARDSIARQT